MAAELRRTRAAGVRSWRGDAVAHHRTSTVVARMCATDFLVALDEVTEGSHHQVMTMSATT